MCVFGIVLRSIFQESSHPEVAVAAGFGPQGWGWAGSQREVWEGPWGVKGPGRPAGSGPRMVPCLCICRALT